MKFTLKQTKIIGLTMELEIKVREYKLLCKELDDFENMGIDPNDSKLEILRSKFIKNQEDIVRIKKQLRELQ